MGLVRLLSELDRNTFDISVITIKNVNPDLETEIPNHVTIHELDLSSRINLRKVISVIEKIRHSDILVCSLFPSVFLGSVIGKAVQVPHIYTWQHSINSRKLLRRNMYKLSYKVSDGILVDSEATKESSLKMGIDERKITVLPISGVKMEEYPEIDYRSPNEPIRIGTVARLVESKGYPELVHCAERLPDLEFHIVGDGPLAEMLRDSPENVICHGRVSQEELHRLWGTLDIYFQPSRYEGLCITAIEAMAVGLPVVASDIDGLSESIIDSETGFLIEQGDIDGYCTKLQFLSNNPDYRERLGTAGKARASEFYSSTAFARRFTTTVRNTEDSI